MDKFVIVVVIAILWLLAPLPNLAQSGTKAEEDLIKIQNDWAAARVNGDIAFLERLYAKELRIHSTNGSIVERDADIANFAAGALKPDYIKDVDMKVSVYGETAVVTGIENVGGTYNGNYGEFSSRFINVFVRRDGRWQLVAGQGTEIRRSGP